MGKTSFSVFLLATAFAVSVGAVDISDTFVMVRAATFQMGSPESEIGRYPVEGPRHEERVSADFEIQATEVTQAQWVRVMKENRSYFKAKHNCPATHQVIDGVELCPDLPADNVSWIAAKDYIGMLNAQNEDYRYRLPTEAEWELAARAGTQTAFSFGDDYGKLDQYAWFDGDYDLGQTHSVGSKLPNAFGLYDMHGNLYEWNEDQYAYYPGSDLPVPTTLTLRLLKGGSWFSMARNLRSAARYGREPLDQNETFGFRVIRERLTPVARRSTIDRERRDSGRARYTCISGAISSGANELSLHRRRVRNRF